MEMTPGQATPQQLDTTDLDDAVPVSDRHTRGFGIQHYGSCRSTFVNHEN